MIKLDTALDLYRHMAWADAAVWHAVLASEAGRADAQIRDCLYHLHLVQRAFLRTWRGEPRDTPFPTFTDIRSIMDWAIAYHSEVIEHLTGAKQEEIPSPMPLWWAELVEHKIGRPAQMTTLGETMLQVVLHSTYHRGQVNSRLRAVGGEPPLVDYVAWLWMGRPVAQWPLVVN